jgi:hypothetical protein
MNLTQRYVIHPQDYTLSEGFLWKERDPADIHRSDAIPFCIWTVPVLFTCITGYGPVQGVESF